MPKAIPDISVGNPTNRDNMPRVKTQLTFPTQVQTADWDRGRSRRIYVQVGLMSLVSFAVTTIWSDLALSEHRFTELLLALAFIALVYNKFPNNLLRLTISAVLVVVSVNGAFFRFTTAEVLVIDSAVLFVFGILFTQHYLSCSHAGWPQLGKPKKLPQVDIGQAFKDALRCWTTYGWDGTKMPGMHRSPVARGGRRQWINYAATLILLCTLPTIPINLFAGAGPEVERMFNFAAFFIAAFFAPVILLPTAAYLVSAPILCRCYATKLLTETDRQFSEVFPALVKSTRNNKAAEFNHTFRGLFVHDRSPIWIPFELEMVHQLLLGGSGSGKTAYLLMLIDSYLRRGDTSLLYLDMKSFSHEPLQQIFDVVPAVRERFDIPFPVKILTNRSGYASHLFSMKDQQFYRSLTPTERTDVEMSSMGISTSREYGQSWFYDIGFAGFNPINQKYPDAISFAEQAAYLDYEIESGALPSYITRGGMQNKLILDRLAACDSINRREHYPQSVLDGAIDLSRLYKEPCAMYAGLNVALAPTAAPEIGRLLLASALKAGVDLKVSERKTNVVLIIDEVQTMITASSILELALQQARAAGVSIIFANQSFSDFRTGGGNDLTSTILNNTTVQSFHKITDPLGVDILTRLGGRTVAHTTTTGWSNGQNGISLSGSTSEQVVNRIELNETARTSAQQGEFLFRVTGNRGLAQYDGQLFAARCPFHITKKKHQGFEEAPWPAPTDDTLIVGQMNPEPPTASQPAKQPNRPTPPKPTIETLTPVLSRETGKTTLFPKKKGGKK